MSVLSASGVGFIDTIFVLDWLLSSEESIINLDKLSHASNLQTLSNVQRDPRHVFVRVDIAAPALPPQQGAARDNPQWVQNEQSGAYRRWVSKQYEGSAA